VLNSIEFFVSEAWTGFKRSGIMSFVAVGTVRFSTWRPSRGPTSWRMSRPIVDLLAVILAARLSTLREAVASTSGGGKSQAAETRQNAARSVTSHSSGWM
jgi:hypothetical protein